MLQETNIKIFTGQKEDQNKIKDQENKKEPPESIMKKNIKPENKLLDEHPSIPFNLLLEAKNLFVKLLEKALMEKDFL